MVVDTSLYDAINSAFPPPPPPASSKKATTKSPSPHSQISNLRSLPSPTTPTKSLNRNANKRMPDSNKPQDGYDILHYRIFPIDRCRQPNPALWIGRPPRSTLQKCNHFANPSLMQTESSLSAEQVFQQPQVSAYILSSLTANFSRLSAAQEDGGEIMKPLNSLLPKHFLVTPL